MFEKIIKWLMELRFDLYLIQVYFSNIYIDSSVLKIWSSLHAKITHTPHMVLFKQWSLILLLRFVHGKRSSVGLSKMLLMTAKPCSHGR